MGNFGIKIITETDAFHTSELGLKMTALKIPFPSPKPIIFRYQAPLAILICRRCLAGYYMRIEAM